MGAISRLKKATAPEPAVEPVEEKPYGRFDTRIALAMGFFSQLDPHPVGLPIDRFTEILCLPLILLGIVRCNASRRSDRYIFIVILVVLSFVFKMSSGQLSFHFGGQNGDLSFLLIYSLYLLAAPALINLLENPQALRAYCTGLIVGGMCSLCIIFLQALGFSDQLVAIGLTESQRTIQLANGLVPRLTGLWGHANETGPVLSIMVIPAGVFWFLNRRLWPLILVTAALLISFLFTLNRSGVIALFVVAAFSLAFSAPGKLDLRRITAFVLILACLYGILLMFPSSPIYQRFISGEGLDENTAGRSATTLFGLGMAMQHPAGMMLDDWAKELKDATGYATPHNGFVALMLAQGLVVPFLLAMAIGRAIIRGLRSSASPLDLLMMLAGLHLSVVFMFEQNNFSFPFIMELSLLIAWLILGRPPAQVPDHRLAKDPPRPRFGLRKRDLVA